MGAIHCALLCALLSGGADDALPSTLSVTGAETVVAVYVEDWRLSSSGTPVLVFAAWGDGRVIWSERRDFGGGTYRFGVIDKSVVAAVVAMIKNDGFFEFEELAKPHCGPEEQFVVIFVKAGDKTLKMQSSHEFRESSRRVVTARDSTPIASRLELMRGLSRDDLFYRLAWDELRLSIHGVVPGTGDKVNGELKETSGQMLWRFVKVGASD